MILTRDTKFHLICSYQDDNLSKMYSIFSGHWTSDGNEEIMKEVSLSGIKSTIFVLDKKLGKYSISFTSIYDEENCELELYYLDDSDNKYKASIIQCTINGQNGIVENGKIINFKLKKDVMYKIEAYTNLNDIYACEVKLYAFR